ncbi:MAG: RNA polymerase sigma factor [Planctomycetota bacterium]
MAFHTTRWSLVARARGAAAGHGEAAKALDELCRIYWPAVYALYRAEGHEPERAGDLTQGLFAALLERGDFDRPDRERGRFRSWLRSCARNWLHNERDRERAKKRGGGRQVVSLDAGSLDTDREEQRRIVEPVDRLDADALFERRWAQATIESALDQLRSEEQAAGRGVIFALVEPVLSGENPARSWAEAAAEIGTSEGALRVAAHRLRRRFRDRLIREVRDTLADPVGGSGSGTAAPGLPAESEQAELAELLRALRA